MPLPSPFSGRVFEYAETDSTSERAFHALAQGSARHGDVHRASHQTQGRGRMGRRWHSAPEAGLYMSVILRPGSQRLVAPGLTMSAGLAVLASIAQLGIRGARLKWPNDLLLEEAKLAGILIESRSQDGSPADYVVGIGINVGQRTFPDELLDERPVTSLALAGHDLAPADLVAPIALALEERLSLLVQDPMACCRDYLQATGLRDARCEVELGQATYQGVLLDLNLSSGLRLKLESGRTQHLALEHVRALRRVPKGPE